MSDTSSILLADAEVNLLRTVRSVQGGNSLEEAFVGWALHGTSDALLLASALQYAASKKGGLLDHTDVAILGFGLACGFLEESQRAAFLDGLARLCGRNPLMHGTPIACCTDAPALLGLAVGARGVGGIERSRLAGWVGQFFDQTCSGKLPADWHRALLHGVSHCLCLTASLPPFSACPPDLRVALRVKGVVPGGLSAPEEDEAATLRLIKTDLHAVTAARAGLRLAALRSISQSACTASLGRPTIPQLVRLLRRVPNGLAQWTWEEKPRTRKGQARQWHVDHEYHVQNLLWFLLSPLFPDLRPEEYTPPVGPYQPRADLGIPSLRVIVEAKFWRQAVKAEKMIEEIAADSSIYFVTGSPYTALIPFVWDNFRRTEEHESLVNGLKQLPHVPGAVVVARPGLMEPLAPPATGSS
jgi:hypothetical protein